MWIIMYCTVKKHRMLSVTTSLHASRAKSISSSPKYSAYKVGYLNTKATVHKPG